MAIVLKGPSTEGLCVDSVQATQIGEFFENKEWLTTKEAARYLGVSSPSLLNMSSNGQVPYHKLGRRNRYLKAELRELLARNRRGGSYGN